MRSTRRLQQVLEHWLARIQVAGISPTDAQRVVGNCRQWTDWCAAWSEEGGRQVALAKEAEAAGRQLTAGEAYRRAAVFYHFAQFMFFDDIEQKTAASQRKVEVYKRGAGWLLPPAEPIAVPYLKRVLHGYLRRPASRSAPLVVIVPGSDSTKEEFGSLEICFLERGLATFSFDGPGQGEGRSFGLLSKHGWGSVLQTVTANIRQRDGLDSRVALFGMAFGGHLVLQGVSSVPDLSAVVCMNGFYDLGGFWDDLPSVYRSNMRFALGGERAEDTAARAREFSLAGVSPPDCPVLVVHGARDRIFPKQEAHRVAAWAGTATEVRIYPEGNHVCNNLAYEYRTLAADWVSERLQRTEVSVAGMGTRRFAARPRIGDLGRCGTLPEPRLTPTQRALVDAEYPRFSDMEMARRRQALEALMAESKVDELLLYGIAGNGPAVTWLTHWPVTTEAAALLTPGKPVRLFVEHFNHLPLARRLSHACEVHWGHRSLLETLAATSANGVGRLGVIGPLPFSRLQPLRGRFGEVVDLGSAYTRLRLVKSEEELDWLRIGAAFTDAGLEALKCGIRHGLRETDLPNLVEAAYVPWGGRTGIHYFGVTPMDKPGICVPAQFPSRRALSQGDVIMTELSASFWGYSGQVLRTFTLGAAPTALYESLHAAADAVFDAIVSILKPGVRPTQIVAAAALIEEAGFTTCDDLVHGYGGGYLPPVIGSRSRPAGPLPDLSLSKGMVLVVQPNVVTRDGQAGVQTGEMVEITANGCRSFHSAMRGMSHVVVPDSDRL